MAKKYDVVVKTGTYIQNGEEKGRYLNVGAVMSGEHGPYMLLNKTFNPAGVPGDPNKDSILLSLFEPRDRQDGPAPKQQRQGYSEENPYANKKPVPSYEDDIPF